MRAAERDELLLRVDRVDRAVLALVQGGREGPRDEGVVAIGHDRDTDPRDEQCLDVRPRHCGHGREGQPGGDRADDLDAEVLEVEHRRRDGRQGHRDEWRRPVVPEEVDREDHHEGRHADEHRVAVRLPDDVEERLQLKDDALAFDLGAGELAQLPDHHEDRGAEEVTDQQRLAQQLGDDPKPGQPGHKAPHRHDEAECGAQPDGPLWVAT